MADIDTLLNRRQQLTLADMNAEAQREQLRERANEIASQRAMQERQGQLAAQQRAQQTSASMADAASNRAYQLQLARERTAAAEREGYAERQTRANLEGARLDETGRQHDAQLWEQGQHRKEQASQFDASRYDAAYNADANRSLQRDVHAEQAYQFDASQAQQSRQFDASKADAVDRDLFSAAHGEKMQAQQYEQQRGMAMMNAGVHNWLADQDLSRQEQLRLSKMQQAVGYVNSDPNLEDWEKNVAITKLKTGIDPLVERQKKAQLKAQEEHNQQIHQQMAQEQSIWQENAAFRAKTFDQRVSAVKNPQSGEQEFWLDLGPGKAPHRVFDDQKGIESAKVMTDWAHKYMETHVNPDGTPVTPAQAKKAYTDLVGEVRSKPGKGTPAQTATYPAEWADTSKTLPTFGSSTQQPAAAAPSQPVVPRRSYEAQQAQQAKEQQAEEARQAKVDAEATKRAESTKQFHATRYDAHLGRLVEADVKKGNEPDLDKHAATAMDMANREVDAITEMHGTKEEKLKLYQRQAAELHEQLKATPDDNRSLANIISGGLIGQGNEAKDKLMEKADGLLKKIRALSPTSAPAGAKPAEVHAAAINSYVADSAPPKVQGPEAPPAPPRPAPNVPSFRRPGEGMSPTLGKPQIVGPAIERLGKVQELATGAGDMPVASAAKLLAQLFNNNGPIEDMQPVDQYWAKKYLAQIEAFEKNRKK